MEWLEVSGGCILEGKLAVQGSKNAALPVLAAAVLHKGMTVLHNCPKIQDVEVMLRILKELGCRIKQNGHTIQIDASGLNGYQVSPDAGGAMRSSILLLGSLLGRCRQACIPYPGGCVIGSRPVDMHLQALQSMGVKIEEKEDRICGNCCSLRGTEIRLRYPSVGATENGILAAVLAEGTTRIFHAAMEPEIEELVCFLNKMGADIRGAGTAYLEIHGVTELHDVEYNLKADRIAAGTYLIAASALRGQVELCQVDSMSLHAVLRILQKAGAIIYEDAESIVLDGRRAERSVSEVKTAPYPGFPTDLQSQLLVLLALAKGTSQVFEQVFEARYGIVQELNRMGAHILVKQNQALIQGVPELTGTTLKATELRGGAALLVAALAAEGRSKIEGYAHIKRGYEDICRDLRSLGAEINIGKNEKGYR